MRSSLPDRLGSLAGTVRLGGAVSLMQAMETVGCGTMVFSSSATVYGDPVSVPISEHFARNLLDDLQDRAESPDNLRWGSDLREILLRYGQPIGWERIQGASSHLLLSRGGVVTHYAPESYEFLPGLRTVREPTRRSTAQPRVMARVPRAR